MISEVADILNRFPEVHWDRCVRHENQYCKVFGWIRREDGDRDFVLLEWECGETWLTTSSARHSREFGRRLHGDEGEHRDCERVSMVFGGKVLHCVGPWNPPEVKWD